MRKFGTVAIVCVGLGMLGLAVLLLQGELGFVTPGEDVVIIVLSLVPPATAALIGLYLIANRDRYAQKWFEDDTVAITLDAQSIIPAVVLLIGLWFLASSAAYLARAVVNVFQSVALERLLDIGYRGGTAWVYATQIIPPLVDAAIGFMLIRNADRVSAWLERRARPADSAPPLPVCPECGAPFNPDDYDLSTASARCTACGHELKP